MIWKSAEDRLKEAVINHPELPIRFMVGTEANIADYGWMASDIFDCKIGEILEHIDFDKVFTDRDELIDELRNFWDYSSQEIEERIDYYDEFWEDCILVYIDN